MEMLLKFLKGDEGATMVEYAFMVMLIALVCIVAVAALGNTLSPFFQTIAGAL
jgi:pilus assembly protein Flp/PilA